MKCASLSLKVLPKEVGRCHKVSLKALTRLFAFMPLTFARSMKTSFGMARIKARQSPHDLDKALTMFVVPFFGLASFMAIVAEGVVLAISGRLAAVGFVEIDLEKL